MSFYDLIVIGGGAAGVFAAVNFKEQHPEGAVLLLEKSSQLLAKVRISGGGRCNVTHACFDPQELIKNYPRGSKELLGPFHRFQPRDTVEWFAARAVPLKVEADGRMFPVTNSSQTIIDCLLDSAAKNKVEIRLKTDIHAIQKIGDLFQLELSQGVVNSKALLLATGSHPSGYNFAKSFGHTIQEPVPSLFTFNVPAFPLKDLAGISVAPAAVQIVNSTFTQQGALLITHWGFSGPAALKLSAWAARYLFERQYQVELSVNWLPTWNAEELMQHLQTLRTSHPNQQVSSQSVGNLPKNLWKRLCQRAGLEESKYAAVSNTALYRLSKQLSSDTYSVKGKTTHKEEFVTCGGVTLAEINFKTMESRLCKDLYFAGEILDIDAVTGGFNFQSAWTTGWLVAHAIKP